VLAYQKENVDVTCGAPAKWRATDGTHLCDKHKEVLLGQQLRFGVEPISE
jgi:hypothetical protein